MTPGKRTGLGVGKPEKVSLPMAPSSPLPLLCPLSPAPRTLLPQNPVLKTTTVRPDHQPLQPPSADTISTTRGAALPLSLFLFLGGDPSCLQFGALRCTFTPNLFITI